MKVKVHNDGKEKKQSYTAYIEEERVNGSLYDIQFSCRGYGESEKEAIENMEGAARHIYSMIGNMPMEGGHNIMYVDCFGQEIK
jgi:hypothetical protein